MTVLANDGIHPDGQKLLEDAGLEVLTDHVPQSELAAHIRKKRVAAVLVRSATRITPAELSSWDGLKVIGRAGVGMDNIDLELAASKGIEVVNTPAASSQSVAELVLAHLFTVCRFLQLSNREMPVRGGTAFGKLKKNFSSGIELSGKTLGIIGFGRIGRHLAQMALGMGMKVTAYDPFVPEAELCFEIQGFGEVRTTIATIPLSALLASADMVSVHVPDPKSGPLIGKKEFDMMKQGVMIVNAARGGVIDEQELLAALESGRVAGAGLDVYANEPSPDKRLLAHSQISLSPHIGASTLQAQQRIGIELAEKVIEALT